MIYLWHILHVHEQYIYTWTIYVFFFVTIIFISFYLHLLLFLYVCLKLISDTGISYISSVDFLPRDQHRHCDRSLVPEEPEIVNYQPQHSDEIRAPVISLPINRYNSSCSSFFCCRRWISNTVPPDNICSVCKKPISKYYQCADFMISFHFSCWLILECIQCLLSVDVLKCFRVLAWFLFIIYTSCCLWHFILINLILLEAGCELRFKGSSYKFVCVCSAVWSHSYCFQFICLFY